MAKAASRRPLRAILALGIVTIAALVLFLLLVPLGGSESGDGGTTVGGHPLLGELAPEIDLATLDGDPMTLSELRGRPVLVNFWATWCLPCRDEFPLMVQTYAEHADDGLEILGIVHDDTVKGAREFVADMGATWPILLDPDDVAWEDYTGVAMPTSFFIDPGGVVSAFSLGGFTETGLTAQLASILPSDPTASSSGSTAPSSGSTDRSSDPPEPRGTPATSSVP